MRRPYDCVAVPLPPSFQEEVEAAVERLPDISVVVQVDAEEDDEYEFGDDEGMLDRSRGSATCRSIPARE